MANRDELAKSKGRTRQRRRRDLAPFRPKSADVNSAGRKLVIIDPHGDRSPDRAVVDMG